MHMTDNQFKKTGMTRQWFKVSGKTTLFTGKTVLKVIRSRKGLTFSLGNNQRQNIKEYNASLFRLKQDLKLPPLGFPVRCLRFVPL